MISVNHQTLANWVQKDKIARGERLDPKHVDPERVKQLEREVAELKMERDVLKRSVVLWVKERACRGRTLQFGISEHRGYLVSSCRCPLGHDVKVVRQNHRMTS
jgi:hypothetical protein